MLTFGWNPTYGAPAIAPGSTTVEITLTPDDGGGGIVALRHSGLPVPPDGAPR